MRIKTEIPLTLRFICRALSTPVRSENPNKKINAICTDSREACENDIYLSLSGEKFNGDDFISEAKSRGAYTVGSLNSLADFKISVPNDSLLHIAKSYKNLIAPTNVIAITGSVGKSTTKNLIAFLLSKKYSTHSTYKNYNNEFGVPATILSAKKDTHTLVIEAGMNHFGELQKISECLKPTISVITKIGTAHIGNLGSRENIAKAKLEILSGMEEPFALIPYGEYLLEGKIKNKKTVSLSNMKANYCFCLKDEALGLYTFKTGSEEMELYISELLNSPYHIPECAAFALAACYEAGMNKAEIQSALSSIDLASFNSLTKISDITVINDSYNSSYESVQAALKTLKAYKNPYSILLGDMLELGDMSEELHKKIGFESARSGISKLYLIGKYSKYTYDGAISAGFDARNIFINDDCDAPLVTATQIMNNSRGEVVLFKASRKLRLERILEILIKTYKKV